MQFLSRLTNRLFLTYTDLMVLEGYNYNTARKNYKLMLLEIGICRELPGGKMEGRVRLLVSEYAKYWQIPEAEVRSKLPEIPIPLKQLRLG